MKAVVTNKVRFEIVLTRLDQVVCSHQQQQQCLYFKLFSNIHILKYRKQHEYEKAFMR